MVTVVSDDFSDSRTLFSGDRCAHFIYFHKKTGHFLSELYHHGDDAVMLPGLGNEAAKLNEVVLEHFPLLLKALELAELDYQAIQDAKTSVDTSFYEFCQEILDAISSVCSSFDEVQELLRKNHIPYQEYWEPYP